MVSLVLAVDVPVPPDSGARLRVLHLCRALAAALGGDVVVGAPSGVVTGEPFATAATGAHRGAVSALVRSAKAPYQAAKLNVPGIRRLVASRAWSVVQAPLFLLPSALSGPGPVVLDAYDIESETFRSMAQAEPSPVRRARWEWEARKTTAFERSLVPEAAAACATSDAGAAFLERLGAQSVTVVPNGVDVKATEHRTPSQQPRLVFVGSFDYRPNVDAVTELARRILPRVRATLPSAEVVVVGRNSDVVQHLAGDGVSVVGAVDDVVSQLHSARVAVMPLRSGSGTRLKVLEAMAAGVPIVATSFGVSGIDVVDGRHVLTADAAADLADAAVRVLTDDALSRRLSIESRALVEQRYDWSVVATPLIELHQRLAAR